MTRSMTMANPYQRLTAETDDGFHLALFRRVGEAGAVIRGPAALLLPGMGANRFTFGLEPERGLPALLAAAGWDVWLGEFRGTRTARRVRGGPAGLGPGAKLSRDLPAMLRAMTRYGAAPQPALIGHSLGGLLALLHAGGAGAGQVSAVITLCAPGVLEEVGRRRRPFGMAALDATAVAALSRVERLRVAPLARLRGPVPHLIALRAHFSRGTMTAAERRDYFDRAVEDIPGPELAELFAWQRTGRLRLEGEAAGPCLFETRLPEVRVPSLTVAAARDGVVPLPAARAVYERLPAAGRRWLEVGRRTGASRDYGHADLLLGRDAERDVLRPIVEWLRSSR